MRPGETLLEMAERHVSEGRRHIQTQERVLAELREMGAPTAAAEALLTEFRSTLRDHRNHLRRIRREQRSGVRNAAGDLAI